MDIGIQEIVFISVIALIVLGPERLPQTIKTLAIWLNRLKRSFNEIKQDLEAEINADEIRAHIHNENVLKDLGESSAHLNQTLRDTERQIQASLETIGSVNTASDNEPSANASPSSTDDKA